VIEEMSSTTVLGPGHHAEVDRFGTLIISLATKGRA
jgi:N-methylhydantoinase A